MMPNLTDAKYNPDYNTNIKMPNTEEAKNIMEVNERNAKVAVTNPAIINDVNVSNRKNSIVVSEPVVVKEPAKFTAPVILGANPVAPMAPVEQPLVPVQPIKTI